MIRIKPKFSLKLRYELILRLGLVTALLLLIVMLVVFPRFRQTALANKAPDRTPEFLPAPPVVLNIDTPKPPERPAIPVPSTLEDFSEDVPFEPTTDFGGYVPWGDPPPPPEPDEQGIVHLPPFIEYDEAPEPIGGPRAILANVIYPPIAVEAQIEGTIFVQAFINERGIVTECKVIRGIPNTGLDEAACAAVFKTKFKPAKQRDRNVGVYMSIPIVFKIKDS